MWGIKPTVGKLQLAEKFYIYPRGVIEYVLVKIKKFIFPTDFVVLDMEEDKDVEDLSLPQDEH